MAAIRVHELAKELGAKSKELVELLQGKGFEAKSHMTALTDEMETVIREAFADSEDAADAKKKSATAAAEKKAVKPEKKKTEKKETAKVEPEKADKKADDKKAAKKDTGRKPEKLEPGELGVISLSQYTTIRQFASKVNRKTREVMAKLAGKGVNAGANQLVDVELLEELAGEFGYLVEMVEYAHEAIADLERPDEDADLQHRIPVVTMMGHVDHGKTSLLDNIRSTTVTEREAGGITQHIGAYQVATADKRITFLDTPGHEAFTMMRARGADVTDIVILVIAAEEGIKPQTIEAINHAKAAGVALIVAMNKVDKPEANPDRVKQQLLEHDLMVEDYGGDLIAVPVSAKTGKGLDELLDYISLVAEMLELKANADRPARGSIIEARVDKGKGPVATVLVQNGTLKRGDIFTCGTTFGRVRAMLNDRGQQVEEAGPSDPVEILGFNDVPMAGDRFYAVTDEAMARDIANAKKMQEEELAQATPVKKMSLEELFSRIEDDNIKELPIVLKADVQGSVETIEAMLEKLTTKKVKINVIHKGVGAVSENDVLLAKASNAIIIGFHVRAGKHTVKLAEQEGIDIRIHNIIYELTNEIKAAMLGMLDPVIKEEITGHVEVRQVFKVPKIGLIAGSFVLDGVITRKSLVRVYRDNIMIHDGKLSSLKRFKDDASEVKQGFECGVGIDNFNDLREGDEIEVYIKKEVADTLE